LKAARATREVLIVQLSPVKLQRILTMIIGREGKSIALILQGKHCLIENMECGGWPPLLKL